MGMLEFGGHSVRGSSQSAYLSVLYVLLVWVAHITRCLNSGLSSSWRTLYLMVHKYTAELSRKAVTAYYSRRQLLILHSITQQPRDMKPIFQLLLNLGHRLRRWPNTIWVHDSCLLGSGPIIWSPYLPLLDQCTSPVPVRTQSCWGHWGCWVHPAGPLSSRVSDCQQCPRTFRERDTLPRGRGSFSWWKPCPATLPLRQT